MADYPITVIVVMLIFTAVTSIKIILTETEDNFKISYTPTTARSLQEMKIYQEFTEGDVAMVLIFVTAKDGGSMHRISHLNETAQIIDYIGNHFPIRNTSFYQFCTNFCAANEPVVQFRNGLLVQEDEVRRHGKPNLENMNLSYPFSRLMGREVDMTPNFFGVQTWNFYERPMDAVTNIKDLRLILLMFRADKPSGWTDKDVTTWSRKVAKYYSNDYVSDLTVVRMSSMTYTQDELIRTERTLLPYLSVGFCIMVTVSICSVFVGAIILNQWSLHKISYAVNACICPLLASAAALGFLFWCGFRFGSILLVTPFLVLAIGVDDAFIMINSWERLCAERARKPVQDDILRNRMAAVLIDIGPSITITSLTNVLAFGISAMSTTPEIRLLCVSNMVAMAFDFFYTITLYAAVFAIGARYEMANESKENIKRDKTDKPDRDIRGFVNAYCEWLSNRFTFSMVIVLMIAYWGTSIYGALQVKPGLTPTKLFIADSPLIEVQRLRNTYIDPNYSFVTIFVNKAGNLSDPARIQRIKTLVDDYESMAECNGPQYTHIWIREYEKYLASTEEEEEETGEATAPYSEESIMKFIDWPENHHWGGFVKRNNKTNQIERFFFIVKYHGKNMSEWNEKLRMLTKWRAIADRYPDLNVSVFEDEATFSDQLLTLVPLTLQTSICTLLCMSATCFLFMYDYSTMIIASSSIFSIFVGVFGLLTLWDISLDPISMSVIVLSIGLSVDFPAHISYHFHRTSIEAGHEPIVQRMSSCLSAIGVPLLQCCLSTVLYVFCLAFVDCYFREIFIKTVIIVILLGTAHALFIIPATLCALSPKSS